MARQAGKARGQTTNPIRMNRLKAMSHPLRSDCFRLLVERGEMSPSQVARELGRNVTDVSYHMRRLANLNCAEIVRERSVRGAVEHFYVATDRPMIDTEEWEDLDLSVAEDFVCEIMKMIINDFIASRRAGIVGADRHFHMTRTPVTLDAQGFEEVMEAYEALRLLIAEIEAQSVQRQAQSGEPPIRASSSLAFFKLARTRA